MPGDSSYDPPRGLTHLQVILVLLAEGLPGLQLESLVQDNYVKLVGGLEHFFHILGIVTPTDKLIFFRGVVQPPTRKFKWAFWLKFPTVDIWIQNDGPTYLGHFCQVLNPVGSDPSKSTSRNLGYKEQKKTV